MIYFGHMCCISGKSGTFSGESLYYPVYVHVSRVFRERSGMADVSHALERRTRNRKEEIDKKSRGWLAQENHTSQEEKDATNPLAAPGRTFRARRADSEEDSESEIVCVFAPAPP